MQELSVMQMEEIEGGMVLACLGVGLITIGVGLSGPIGWGAFAFLAAGSAAAGYAACFG